jgi:hypothetical protein
MHLVLTVFAVSGAMALTISGNVTKQNTVATAAINRSSFIGPAGSPETCPTVSAVMFGTGTGDEAWQFRVLWLGRKKEVKEGEQTRKQSCTLKNVVFWDVAPCGTCKNQRFGGL